MKKIDDFKYIGSLTLLFRVYIIKFAAQSKEEHKNCLKTHTKSKKGL